MPVAISPATRLAVFMRALHSAVGLFAAPWLLIAAVTGLAYAATPQLTAWWYAPVTTADTAGAGASLSLTRQIEIARQARPEAGPPVALRPGQAGETTTRVMFARPGADAGVTTAVFVDPGTGRIHGQLASYGTSGALPIRRVIDKLHRSLLLGAPGRLYSELAASWLAVAALGGLVLWGRARRARRAPRRARAWHRRLGPWLVIGLLGFSITGLTWSQFAGQRIATLRVLAGWQTPALSAATTSSTAKPGTQTYDSVLATARRQGLGADRIEIRAPRGNDTTWTVAEIDRRWPSQVDRIAVDSVTGAPVAHSRFADWPLAAKLTRWGIDGHMGVLFGWVNQLVLAVFATGLIALIVSGWVGLIQRRRQTARMTLWHSLVGLTRRQQIGLGVTFCALAFVLPVWAASCPLLVWLDARAPGLSRFIGRPSGPPAA